MSKATPTQLAAKYGIRPEKPDGTKKTIKEMENEISQRLAEGLAEIRRRSGYRLQVDKPSKTNGVVENGFIRRLGGHLR